LAGRQDKRRTEFAEILDVGGEDVVVEFVAVSNGEKDRVEFADGAYVVWSDGRESNARRRHERGRRRESG
jgi:membrane-bound inhibitor of C-type lysozyme